MAVSSPKIPLADKPGVSNWVEKYGALKPKGTNWIRRAAEHLQGKGMAEGHAIATAKNAAEKLCASGDLNFPGVQQANAGSRAQACAAIAKWNAARAAANAARIRECELDPEHADDALMEATLARSERVVLNTYGPLGLVEAKSKKADDYSLKPGDAGDNVRHLQARMGALGHKLKVDGTYGDKTAAGVREFRKGAGLADGDHVDSDAVKALRDADAPGPSTRAISRDPAAKPDTEVASMQKGLVEKGYDVGDDPEGVPGSGFSAGVRKFQRDHGLRQDGVVGRHTRAMMGAMGVLSEAASIGAYNIKHSHGKPKGPGGQPLGRGGKPATDPNFEKQHPRAAKGRVGGGQWITASGGGRVGQAVRAKLGVKDGQNFHQAVTHYQRRNNLQVDGVIGAQTASSLLGAKPHAPGAITHQVRRRLHKSIRGAA